MERPALQRLLRDVESGAIDVIVVYKVDQLSRSLTDFARDVVHHKLVVNDKEVTLVQMIFRRFLRVGSATKLAQELRRAGHTTKA